ncbi:hypothetical protein Tco_1157071 [Tanacetum coccineum]
MVPVVHKVEVEPLSPKLKNNKEAHVDYIRITKENADTLRDVVEQARTSNPLDNYSEHSSLGPAFHEMTPAKISLGLVPNLPPLTSFVPPLRTDWDLLFQLLFGELLTPSPSIDHPAPEVIALIAKVVAPEPAASTGLPSSTTVDQDAPSRSNSQTTPETQSPVIPNEVEEDNHDLDVGHT